MVETDLADDMMNRLGLEEIPTKGELAAYERFKKEHDKPLSGEQVLHVINWYKNKINSIEEKINYLKSNSLSISDVGTLNEDFERTMDEILILMLNPQIEAAFYANFVVGSGLDSVEDVIMSDLNHINMRLKAYLSAIIGNAKHDETKEYIW